MSKILKTKEGVEFIVDAEDYEHLSLFLWSMIRRNKRTGTEYVASSHYGRTIRLSRYLLKVTDPKIFVDHINGNTLDNRKSNLRLSTPQENRRNSGKHLKTAASKYKGVCYNKKSKKWSSRIDIGGNRIFLGYFTEEVEAAKAYDIMAKKHFGEFARLNLGEINE